MNSCKIGDLLLLDFGDYGDDRELGIIIDVSFPSSTDNLDGVPRDYYGFVYQVFWLNAGDVTRELSWEVERFRAAFLGKYG